MTRPAAAPAAPRRVVVIGGGLAGMLAAGTLAEFAEHVTVIDRDALPSGPHPRKGLPQARHVHLLYSGGARAFEDLLPGITHGWLAAGARRISMPTGLVTMTAQGWLHRWPETQFLIACTRDLLDWTVRARVAAHPRVTVLDRHEIVDLRATSGRVTGVRVRPPSGDVFAEPADLVVDACGRGSQAVKWLAAIGAGPVEQATVDSGLVYASRLYHAPEGTDEFPVINVQSVPSDPVPGQTATIVPVEGGRWQVTLSGTRGGEPTRSPEAFEPFAGQVRHSIVGDLISRTRPVSPEVVVTRSTVNGRRFFEKARTWPEGFIAVGDSVATYNPLYGQGMSVAAQGIVALRDALRAGQYGHPDFARRVQRAIGRTTDIAWNLAASQDILYPGAVGKGWQPPPGMHLANRYVDRLMRTATGRAEVARALLDVFTLSKSPRAWLHPDIAVAVCRGPSRAPLTGPPLTPAERKVLSLPRT